MKTKPSHPFVSVLLLELVCSVNAFTGTAKVGFFGFSSHLIKRRLDGNFDGTFFDPNGKSACGISGDSKQMVAAMVK